MPMNDIRIGVVEDDPTVRESLAEFIHSQKDLQLEFVATSLEAASQFLDHHPPPHVLLLDVGLPGMSGLQGLPRLRQQYDNMDIIILTAFDDSEKIYRALCRGADAYLSKRASLPQIMEAVRIVHGGGSYMTPDIARKVFEHLRNTTKPHHRDVLTPRQGEIVQGLVDGLSYKMIANKYHISLETVNDHIKTIYRKLHVHSKAEVIRMHMEGEI